MKRKIAALLTFVLVLCTCMNAMAASYSVKWSQDASGNWQIIANGVPAKNAWIYDDECDTAGGIYYLVDENGKLVVAPLVLDGEGHYYSFSDQHDGHFGEMITKSGRYYGVDLVFEASHNGGFGSITNKDGIAKLAAKYGVKEMPQIKNSSTVKLSQINKNSYDGGSQEYTTTYKVAFDVNYNKATPSSYETQTVKSGAKAVRPASPSDINKVKTFKGWSETVDGSDYFDFENTAITKNMTLYAQWGVDGYVVNYDGNGADNPEAEPVDTTIYKSGDFVTIKSPGALAKEGFIFKEWNTQRDGSGDGYKAGETIMINEDKQFYAIWETKPAANYLTFTAEAANSSVTINYKSGTDVMYSKDGGETWTAAPSGTKVSLAAIGDSFCMKGKGFVTGSEDMFGSGLLGAVPYECFAMTGKIKASGSITSLLDEAGVNENVTLPNYCFALMFMDCTALTEAPQLIAKNLSTACYMDMFSGCTSLTAAPQLPATTLSFGCYSGMFRDCTGLTAAPQLNAETLADGCYNYMFNGCTALTKAPSLPATTLAKECYKGMFRECTALTDVPETLPATTLADECYDNMFSKCTALTEAPALPATTLTYRCYYEMFADCTALATAQSTLPAVTLAKECYYQMYQNSGLTVAPTFGAQTAAENCCECMFIGTKITTAPVLPATVLAKECYSNMFNNCKELTTVPENMLPATTLAVDCYRGMFYNCSKLTNVPALNATELKDKCYQNMFTNCTGLITVPDTMLPATTLATYCYNQMFCGCTKLVSIPKLDATVLIAHCYEGMFMDCSGLGIYSSSAAGRTAWSIPAAAATSAASATGWNYSIFYGTGGIFRTTGKPDPGTTYYYGANTPE